MLQNFSENLRTKNSVILAIAVILTKQTVSLDLQVTKISSCVQQWHRAPQQSRLIVGREDAGPCPMSGQLLIPGSPAVVTGPRGSVTVWKSGYAGCPQGVILTYPHGWFQWPMPTLLCARSLQGWPQPRISQPWAPLVHVALHTLNWFFGSGEEVLFQCTWDNGVGLHPPRGWLSDRSEVVCHVLRCEDT